MKDPPALNPAQLAELRRQCGLVLDLADEEVQTRHRCAKDGHGEEQEVRDLEADVAAVQPCIQSLPAILRLLSQAVTDWPQFDGDEDVSGADLVDWFGQWRDNVKACMAGLASSSDETNHTAVQAALDKGFVVLTHNAGNDPGSQYEAWAYEGPLDFDNASSVRFGLGADPIEAIHALNWQLQHILDRPTD
jgi:hypothetical protein